MIKKLCVAGIAVAAAGTVLLAAPAYADNTTGSSNNSASQSGNTFNNVVSSNVGDAHTTNVNNVNGNTLTAANASRLGSWTNIDD
ncbi:hypothetical protein [Nonomuraea rhizosphaerae]|uniref:hypothetical protein n=1 Tax=Nonomuraea rhizosphaerae TaxID=2665663 RepID=UPI001C5CC4E9|nr:hypothetical protein [Nonomuraea rhizosphaerae]